MFWFVELAVGLGLSAASMALQPRARKLSSTAAPTNLSKWNLPTVEQRTPIPWIAGRVLLDNPALLGIGDFTAEEVKDGLGTVVSYRYHVGMYLGLCLGPITAIEDIRWDGKSLPGGPIGVGPDTNAIALYDGGLKVAHIAEGFYASPQELCVATSAALDIATGHAEPHYRVRYGHQIVASWNDRVRYQVQVSGIWETRETTLTPGAYGRYVDQEHPELGFQYELFDELERAINDHESGYGHRVTVSCSASGISLGTALALHATGSDGTVGGLRILGTSDDCDLVNLNLGLHINLEVAGEVAALPGDLVAERFAVYVNRVIFGGGDSAAILAWTRAETTSQGLFGVTGNRDYWAIGASAESEIESPVATLTQTDLGERIRNVYNSPNHFGPDDGVSGTLDIWKGTRTQPADDYLETPAAFGAPMPAYRGLAYAVLRKGYVGNSPQFRAFGVLARRVCNPLGLPDEVATINGQANPACVDYEALTGGLPTYVKDLDGVMLSELPLRPDQVQTSDYEAMAWALFREQRGMRVKIDTPMTRVEVEQWIARHVDCVSYDDPQTGKRRVRLIRPDYSLDELLRLGPDSILSCTYQPLAWNETKNLVRVTYIEAAGGFVERCVYACDDANVAARGGRVVEESVTLDGFASSRDAQWAADRLLRALAWKGQPIEITATRAAKDLTKGQPFILDWPELGIANLVCRVAGEVDRGSPGDWSVKFEATPDLWAIGNASYGPPQAPAWDTPTELPGPPAAARLLEAPYALAGSESPVLLALAARADRDQHGFAVHADLLGGAEYRVSNPAARFTPSGTLSGVMGWMSDSFTVRDGTDTSGLASISDEELAAGANLALVDDEWIAWQSLIHEPDGGLTFAGLVRGVLDSVPAIHEAGSRVWFVRQGAPRATDAPLEPGDSVAAKLLTINRAGRLPLQLAARTALELAGRARLPYPPTDVRYDGVLYPDQVATPVALTWEHRDRLGTWSYADAGATALPEDGTTYELTVWNDEGTQVLQETVAGAGYTLASLAQGWRVRLVALRDGLRSAAYDYTVGTNHGWGLAWGDNFGGYLAE